MDLTLVTAPPVEPISLQEAKDHLRVDTTDEDALIDALIMAARQHTEKYLARALITQTWDWNLPCFPREFEVPYPPLQSVTSIKYYDGDNVQQTLSSSVYEVNTASTGGLIREAIGQTWPAHYTRYDAITVRFVAGYGDGVGDVPWPIKAAMLLFVAHLWCNRELATDRPQQEVPFGYCDLLAPYVIWKF